MENVSDSSSATIVAERRAPSSVDQRHLAEALAGPAHRDRRRVAQRRHHLNRKTSPDDQMERVPRVVAVEDNLVAREPPPARDLHQLPHLLSRNVLEQPPLHGATLQAPSIVSAA